MKLTDLFPDINGPIPHEYSEIQNETFNQLIKDYLANAQPTGQPTLTQLMGIPGAGKTTLANELNNTDKLFIGFDAIMESIDEYQICKKELGLKIAFEKWQIPARIIGYEVLRRAIEMRTNILFEHGGFWDTHVDFIKNLKKFGYKTEILYLVCTADVARKRVTENIEKIGRYTPIGLIDIRINKVPEFINKYKVVADSFHLINSTDGFVIINPEDYKLES